MPRINYIQKKSFHLTKGKRIMDGTSLKKLLIEAAKLTTTQLENQYGLSHGVAVRMKQKIRKDARFSEKNLGQLTAKEVLELWYKKRKASVKNDDGKLQDKYLYPDCPKIYQEYLDNVAQTNSTSSSRKTQITMSLLLERSYFSEENKPKAAEQGKVLVSMTHAQRLMGEYKRSKVTPVFRKQHQPGFTAEVDFTGAKAPYMGEDDTIHYADVIVIVLPYSRKVYAQAIENQQSETVCKAISQCFKTWNAVPQTLTVDNFKGAVVKASKYEGEINKYFEQLARFYNFEVITCRPYTPTDKGCCEAHVKIVTRRILASLRADAQEGKYCQSIKELNDYFSSHIDAINNHNVIGCQKTRQEMFAEEIKSMLHPKSWDYSFNKMYTMTVPGTSRLDIIGHQYAVASKWIGAKVDVEISTSEIRIFHCSTMITSYPRKDNTPGLSSKENFSPDNHIIYDGFSLPQKSFLREWAEHIGPNTVLWLDSLFKRRNHDANKARFAVEVMSLPNGKKDYYKKLDELIGELLNTTGDGLKSSSIINKWKAQKYKPSNSTDCDFVYSKENYIELVKKVSTGEILMLNWSYFNKTHVEEKTNTLPATFLNGTQSLHSNGVTYYATKHN